MIDFVFWDVEHGSATYIKTPNNKHIVVDLGTGSYERHDECFSPLNFIRDSFGVRRLDLAVITHPHRDHLDDIYNLVQLSPSTLMSANHLSEQDIRRGNRLQDSDKIGKYLEVLGTFNQPVAPQNRVEAPENWGGARITYFSRPVTGENLNNHSLVLFVEYARCKILIPGDNEAPSWKQLLQLESFRKELPGVDILLAPHHGRDAGFCSDLFGDNLLAPKLTIISDGRFGDTSATSRYGARTSGWKVHYEDGKSEVRKCVTTRADGHINVKLGMNGDKRFIEVHCRDSEAY